MPKWGDVPKWGDTPRWGDMPKWGNVLSSSSHWRVSDFSGAIRLDGAMCFSSSSHWRSSDFLRGKC